MSFEPSKDANELRKPPKGRAPGAPILPDGYKLLPLPEPPPPIVTWLVRPTYGSYESPRTFADADALAAFIRDGWDGGGYHKDGYEGITYSVYRLIDGIIDPEWKPES